jgi:hypothetical protein
LIYINLSHLEDIMRLVSNDLVYSTVYDFSLGGTMVWWRLTISTFNDRKCYTFHAGGAWLLKELGVIRALTDLEALTILDPKLGYEAKERALADYYRGLAEGMITKLDLVTLGEEGSVSLPEP